MYTKLLASGEFVSFLFYVRSAPLLGELVPELQEYGQLVSRVSPHFDERWRGLTEKDAGIAGLFERARFAANDVCCFVSGKQSIRGAVWRISVSSVTHRNSFF